MPQDSCRICQVIADKKYMALQEHGVVFHPEDSKMEGHLIVASRVHVADALANPVITAQVFRLVAMTATKPCTLVAQVGQDAGQMVPHMYVHVIPASEARVDITKRRNK